MITIEKTILAGALKLLSPVAAVRGPLPVLEHLKIEPARPGRILICATNLEQTLSLSVEAECAEEFPPFLVPARKLCSIISVAEGHTVEMVPAEKCITVKSGLAVYQLETIAEEFPEPDEQKEPRFYVLRAEALLSALNMVRHAQSRDESRPVLCGTCLELPEDPQEDSFLAVATDGRRLAYAQAGAEQPQPLKPVLPAPAVDELCRVLACGLEETETVQVSISKVNAVFSVGGGRLTTKLLEGGYPAWRQVIPAPAGYGAVQVNRGELLNKIQQVRVMLADQSAAVQLRFAEDGITLVADEAGAGRAEGMLQFSGGLEAEIACNPVFLSEALKASGAAEAEIRILDAMSPILIRNAGAIRLEQVVMPIRVKGAGK